MNIELTIDGKKVELSEETRKAIQKAAQKKNPLRAEDGEEYFAINETGDPITSHTDYYLPIDDARYRSGNYFLTIEALEKELEKRKALVRIKEYIAINFGEWTPNLNKDRIWTICYASRQEVFYPISSAYIAERRDEFQEFIPLTSFPYLQSRNHAQQLIKDCKDDLEIIRKSL